MLQVLNRPAPSATKLPREPQLTLKWESRGHAFRESLSAFLSATRPLKQGPVPNYFRDSYVRPHWPVGTFVLSILWHAAFIVLLMLPIWNFAQPTSHLAPVRIQLTWSPPSSDLPPITYPGSPAQPSPPGESSKSPARRGADAMHPRQTILSTPVQPSHPRQTLKQSGAPTAPPKLMQQLPNVAEWSGSSRMRGAKRPGIPLRASNAAPRAARSSQRVGLPPPPELSNGEKSPGLFNFGSGPVVNANPRMPIPASSAPRVQILEKQPELTAPQIGSGAKTDAGKLQLDLAANQNSQQPRLPSGSNSTPTLNRAETKDAGPAPDISSSAQQPGIPATTTHVSQPKMPAGSNGSPQLSQRPQTDVGPAPDLGPGAISDANRKLIAISPTPAPPVPVTNPPQGNLAARTSISPQGTQQGVPGGSTNGAVSSTGGSGSSPAATGGTGGAGGIKPGPGAGGASATGPSGVSITGGGPMAGANATSAPSNVLIAPSTIPPNSGANSGSASGTTAGTPSGTSAKTPSAPAKIAQPTSTPTTTASAAQPAPEPPNPALRVQPTLGMERIDAGTTPEQILGSKRVYTIYVNMPNLTSAAGSWVLNFAELQSGDALNQPGGDISSPVPMRKVDPKYPPTLVKSNVEGEVVLYAIIRRDGSVDSIQLLKGVDPQLDQNSMEAFSRWKFRPATRNGTPIDLEAVIHIPFRIAQNY